MIVAEVLLTILIITIPGLLLARLLKTRQLLYFILYAVGLGLLYNLLVGVVVNFTFGLASMPSWGLYLAGLILLAIISLRYGNNPVVKWNNWPVGVIVILIFITAAVLQYQTSLLSSNLVGSDIHLEYYVANMTLENGYWEPLLTGVTINSCLGVAVLLPLWSLMTGMGLVWVFKIICPLLFAVLPVALFEIYRIQFRTVVALLAVIFFITMPMFTMDMVQLIRQQQSLLFFILVVVVLMDENLKIKQQGLLAGLFSIGFVVMHYGTPLGIIGYLLIGMFALVFVSRIWGARSFDCIKPVASKVILMAVLMIWSGILFMGYYSWVNQGQLLELVAVPVDVVENTVKQTMDITSNTEVQSFLDPSLKEPLLQTAIGLDFGRASELGRVWRVLQLMVELSILIGFLVFLFRPPQTVKLMYGAFVLTSVFMVAGMYLLATYSYGLGATRVWFIALLFIAPLFVLGVNAIGGWVCRLVHIKLPRHLIPILSMMFLFVPYYMFNSGFVFELAKMDTVGYIDVPFSIRLSGHRVDINTVFTDADIKAVGWLEKHVDGAVVYGDTHASKLLIQKFGWPVATSPYVGGLPISGHIRALEGIGEDDKGYIFLREWNVKTDMITLQGEYGSRKSFDIDLFEVVHEKIQNAQEVWDGKAKILQVK